MMKRWFGISLMAGVLWLSWGVQAWAELQWETVKQATLEQKPLDSAFSQGDGRLFLLLEGGEVRIYSAAGDLQDSLSLGQPATSLALSPDGGRLFLTDQKSGRLQIVDVAVVYELPIGNSPVKGPADAPITLTVFDDFQCPYCARLVPVLDQVLEAYPEQVKLVFKHFPLSMHKFADQAAVASLAARDQGKFWPMHDKLFANYNQLNAAKIRDLAEEVGLDMERFDQAMGNPAYRLEIIADQRLGQQAGVRGTPALFLNGKLVKNRNLGTLRAMIEQELAKDRPAAQ